MIKLGQAFQVPGLDLPAEAKDLIMQWIPPGSFMMGSQEDEPGYEASVDEAPFLATLSKGFWLGKYPVTQAQWQAIMQNNPSHFQLSGANRPVENVTWFDAISFCDQLNQRLSRDLPGGYQFSLPTEMQWEYACRAGAQTPYYSGNTEADLARVAWYAGNSDEQTHPVGEKEANSLGLYDMHGNVEEWCHDAPSDYPHISVSDWEGKGSGLVRAFRGGSWKAIRDHGDLRAACRSGGPPDIRRSWIGFRLCLRWLNAPDSVS